MAITIGNNSDGGTQGVTSYAHNNNGDFLLVICQSTNAPTGVTYNGVAMTQIGTNQTHTTYGRTINMWGLVNPASGSNTLATSGGTAAAMDIGAVSLSGVNQTSVAAAATGFAKADVLVDATPSISVTTTVDGAYVLGCFFGNWSSVVSGTTVIRQVIETAFQLLRSTNAVSPAAAATLDANSVDGVESVFLAVGINPPALANTTNFFF